MRTSCSLPRAAPDEPGVDNFLEFHEEMNRAGSESANRLFSKTYRLKVILLPCFQVVEHTSRVPLFKFETCLWCE